MIFRFKQIFIIASVALSSFFIKGFADEAYESEYLQSLRYNNRDYIPIEDIPCVDFSQNKFIIPGSDELVMNLYNRIDQILGMGQGKISIMHIGGSHVQAGIFSHRLRENFRWFIDDEASCMGMIFPYKSMGTNAPTN